MVMDSNMEAFKNELLIKNDTWGSVFELMIAENDSRLLCCLISNGDRGKVITVYTNGENMEEPSVVELTQAKFENFFNDLIAAGCMSVSNYEFLESTSDGMALSAIVKDAQGQVNEFFLLNATLASDPQVTAVNALLLKMATEFRKDVYVPLE